MDQSVLKAWPVFVDLYRNTGDGSLIRDHSGKNRVVNSSQFGQWNAVGTWQVLKMPKFDWLDLNYTSAAGKSRKYITGRQ